MTQVHSKCLITALTGIDFSKFEDSKWNDDRKVVAFCAEKAYLDLCRTLTYNEPKGISEDKLSIAKQKFKQTITDTVVSGVLDKLLPCTPAEFDSTHNELLKEIAEKARGETIDGTGARVIKKRKRNQKSSSFTIGQAQKWVNMTIKYMWLTGKWDQQLEQLEHNIHAPIDNFILKELYDHKEENGLSGKINKDGSSYSIAQQKFGGDDYSAKAPWSRIESIEAYISLQKAIRDTHAADSGILEWESKTWIKNAKNAANDPGSDRRRNKDPWAYSKSHGTILVDYTNIIDLEKSDIADLYEFYVLHTPCHTCGCLQSREFSYYGWAGSIVESGAREALDTVLALNSDCFYLPENGKRAIAKNEFAKRSLPDGPVDDLITERAVACPTSESSRYLRLFKHIRNCLAHGRFTAIINEENDAVLIMEDIDTYNITARIVLKLNTLLGWRDVIINSSD